MNSKTKNILLWLGVILAAGLLERAALWIAYPVAAGNDTQTYLHLSSSIRNNPDFSLYNGTRTPGYPLFLMWAGSNSAAYLIQLFLGLLTTLLVFYIALKLSKRPWFAGLLALAHTLNLGQLFFEAALLSEALSTFLLFLCMAGLIFLFLPSEPSPNSPKAFSFNGKNLLASLLVGLAAVALAMTRPLFAFVPFWGAFFLLFWGHKTNLKTRLAQAVLVLVPTLVILLLWVNFIHSHFNIIGLDSIGGYHLVNHVSSFFELTPDQYSAIRETFLKFRASHIAESGSPVNTIWDAIPQLMKQTHLNYYSLGRLMGKISTDLIRAHPDLYLQNLARGWWWFWKVGVFWLPGGFSISWVRSLLSGLMLLERWVLFGVNLLFLAGSLALLPPKTRTWLKPNSFLWFSVGAIWITSILQTLAEHGDNARFLAPMQTLVLLVVAGWCLNLFSQMKAKQV